MMVQAPWSNTQLTGLSRSHLTCLELPAQTLEVHKNITHDFTALIKAAYQQGFELTIASGFRDFQRQQAIWDGKFSGQRPLQDSQGNPLDISTLSDEKKIETILRWSALPGGSRHHWGTDFDVYAKNRLPKGVQLQLEPWEYLTGHQVEFYSWLKQEITQFGFFFPYAKDLNGVAFEPWHISHKALATSALEHFSPELLSTTLRAHPIQGLNTVLKRLDEIYTQYITNISTN